MFQLHLSRFARLTSPVLLTTALVAGLFATSAQAYTDDIPLAVDTNPDPNIFETTITADEALIDVDGDGTPDEVFAFNGSIPGPTIQVTKGDVVIVHFVNNLDTLPSTIHWHGIKVNNASDGSQVVQPEVEAGESFTYQFLVTQSGVAWYHPHVLPSDQTFRGLYGAVIMMDPHETTLANAGVIPPLAEAKTVIFSDTTVCSGTEVSGVCSQSNCGAMGGMACAANQIPFVQPKFNCRTLGAGSCNVALGTTVLINGRPLEPDDALAVSNGEGVRLRLINAAIFRYLRLVPPPGHQFFRIGGQGGLLNNVRVEGGVQGTYDTLYLEGEILLAPADRADVILIPSFHSGGSEDKAPPPWSPTVTVSTAVFSTAQGGVHDVLRFEIVGPPNPSPFTIADGDPLLTHPLVNDPLVSLPDSGFADLLDPATEIFGSPLGSDNTTITFTAPVTTACSSSVECYTGTECRDVDVGVDLLCPDESTSANCACVDDGPGPGIDGVRGLFDMMTTTGPDDIPHLNSSRWARNGDLLELSIYNSTANHHPFHLHGFEYQPVRIEDGDTGDTLYTFDYVELVDNHNVMSDETLVFRVELDDRPLKDDVFTGGEGGAEGRWLFHCHIFTHAGLGMISELVVLPPADIFSDGFESGNTSVWANTIQ